MAVEFPKCDKTGIVLLLTATLFTLPIAAFAGPLLFANNDRPFGPSGGQMGGMQTALVGGTDAAWANPAGLARDSRSEFYLDAGTLDLTDRTVGKIHDSAIESTPGAIGWVSGPTRARPRFGFATFLHTPTSQSTSTQLTASTLIGGSDLPSTVSGTLNYGNEFPSGISQSEYDSSTGSLTVVSPGAGMGVRISDWLRLGVSLRLERVSLRVQDAFTEIYSGSDSTTTENRLTGSSQSSAAFTGDSYRAVATLGLQMDLGPRLVLGIVSEQPSLDLGGVGRVRVDRVDNLLVTEDGTAAQQAAATVHIASDKAAFQLRRPGALRVGLGMVFDSLALEVDLEQTQALPRYKVFPALESSPPSTTAAQQDALTTQIHGVTRYAVGAAFAQGNQASWFFGFATDPSPVSGNDPIFRKIDLYRFSTGYYVTRGAFSASLRAIYTTADAPAVKFPHLTDDNAVTAPVQWSAWSFGASGSYVY